ncbi:MAG TPA: L,D-transpeptidase family protein [Longimicrobiales bacterium]
MRLRRHIWRSPAYCAALLLVVGTGNRAEAQLARPLGLLPSDSAGALARTALLPTQSSFALSQLRNPRVLDARIATRFRIKQLFDERGIRYPAAEVFIRIFKRERALELWVRPDGNADFELLKSYDICALAGELGPKRRQGDSQVPEGFYAIDFFNPQSDYHLSLHVDYPNVRDRMEGHQGLSLGGEIYIHGGCSSDGCLAVTDDGIKELYWIAVEARAVGQQRIPVHIFPARLESDDLQRLQRAFDNEPGLGAFWATLKPGYDFFEQNRRLPAVRVDRVGNYVVTGPAENASEAVVALDSPAPLGRKTEEAPNRKLPLGTRIGG